MAKAGGQTKEERQRREALIASGFFNRDHEVYKAYEAAADGLSDYDVAYLFCGQCEARNYITVEAMAVDDKYAGRAHPILTSRFFEITGYAWECRISQEDAIGIFGKKRALKLLDGKGFLKVDAGVLAQDKNSDVVITGEEIGLMAQYFQNDSVTEISLPKHLYRLLSGVLPITLVHDLRKARTSGRVAQNSIFAELDLSKPKAELLAFVEQIKDAYDADPANVPTVYDVLGVAPKPFKCDIGACDVLSRDKSRPLAEKLADVLYIYDCKKAGLTWGHVLDQIKQHRHGVGMQERTAKEYHALAVEYIDNQKYKCYISGYDHPTK